MVSSSGKWPASRTARAPTRVVIIGLPPDLMQKCFEIERYHRLRTKTYKRWQRQRTDPLFHHTDFFESLPWFDELMRLHTNVTRRRVLDLHRDIVKPCRDDM